MNTLPGVRDRGRWLSALKPLLVVVRASVGSLVVVGTGVAQDTPLRWEMTEELRIGAVEGPEALSAVHRLTVDAHGERLYVPQEMSGRVRVFDARSGESLYSIGRSGEGPGEFREVLSALSLGAHDLDKSVDAQVPGVSDMQSVSLPAPLLTNNL